jgi:hypothetical protein
MRKKLAYDVYVQMLQDTGSESAEQKFQRYFELLWTKFWSEMNKPEHNAWLKEEEDQASV